MLLCRPSTNIGFCTISTHSTQVIRFIALSTNLETVSFRHAPVVEKVPGSLPQYQEHQ